jgi:SpoVK/Ycf46/Vps4 family AAA+-type ATPase
VKCGVCQELLLRGQKDEHEKVCLGRGANPKAAAAAAAAAAARVATKQAKLAALGARAAQQRTPADPPPADKNRMGARGGAPVTKENAGPGACSRGPFGGLPDADIRRGEPPARGGAPGRAAPAHPRKAPAQVPPAVTRVPIVPSRLPSKDARPVLNDSDAGLDLRARLQKHELMATLKPNANKVYIGDRAEVGGRKGTVMFVGPAEFAGGGVVVGLRLDEKRATSECDGKYDGERLFRCKPGFGIFVPVEDVKKVEDEKDEDDWESLVGKRPNDVGGANGVEKSSMEDSEKYDPTRALERVVGQEAAKAKIQNLVNALQVNRRRVAAGGRAEPAPHVVLAGAPGVGKSMLARMVAHIVSECDVSRHGPLVRPSRQDLVALGRAPGRTAELVAQQCEKAEGGVLLIDDFHRMLPDARGDAAGARDAPGYEAMEALASEVERRARKAGKGIVLILAGEAEGVAAARRACPPLDALLPEPLALPDFSPREVAILVDAMASERGFALAPGLRDDARLEAHVAEAARCADPARRNAHLARSLLERAIDAQTERVFSLGTVGKDTLTVLTVGDFIGPTDGASAGNDGDVCLTKAQDETEKALLELERVVGLDGVKDFVRSLRAQLLVEKERVSLGLPSGGGGVLHMVFAGNPGTGKTTVARIIANLLKALGVLRKGHLVEADRSSLVAGYSGQTALKTKAVVNEALGGVLFVDEAYALVSGDRDAFGKEALDTLMKEMEDHRSDLVVIAAGYNDEMRDLLAANPGMESRFPTTLRFADYDARELMKIADSILQPQKLTLGEGASDLLEAHFSAEIEHRAEGTKGSNGRGVRNLLEAAKRAQALRLAEIKRAKTLEDLTTLTAEDCAAACGVQAPKKKEGEKKKGFFM